MNSQHKRLQHLSWAWAPHTNRACIVGIDKLRPFVSLITDEPLATFTTLTALKPFTSVKQVPNTSLQFYNYSPEGVSPSDNRLQKAVESLLQKRERKKNPSSQKAKPTPLSIQQAAKLMQGKGVIMTGSGLSRAAGVMDWNECLTHLGSMENQPTDVFTQGFFTNPEAIFKQWDDFVFQVEHGYDPLKATQATPTPAHLAVEQLRKLTGAQVVSENFDPLHGLAGTPDINPTNAETLRAFAATGQADWVLRVGHRVDAFGVLKGLKERTPSLAVISINLDIPYVTLEGELILQGDCQVILPQVVQCLLQSKND